MKCGFDSEPEEFWTNIAQSCLAEGLEAYCLDEDSYDAYEVIEAKMPMETLASEVVAAAAKVAIKRLEDTTVSPKPPTLPKAASRRAADRALVNDASNNSLAAPNDLQLPLPPPTRPTPSYPTWKPPSREAWKPQGFQDKFFAQAHHQPMPPVGPPAGRRHRRNVPGSAAAKVLIAPQAPPLPRDPAQRQSVLNNRLLDMVKRRGLGVYSIVPKDSASRPKSLPPISANLEPTSSPPPDSKETLSKGNAMKGRKRVSQDGIKLRVPANSLPPLAEAKRLESWRLGLADSAIRFARSCDVPLGMLLHAGTFAISGMPS